ncbi:MAG TPA: DUF167 domain-containing protein [Pyrinomonadaceae bacterium]|nr:DUF167 domain-containing protein [Pyrinomonadaceae bacterium]
MLDIITTTDGVEFKVRVNPRASKTEIIGTIDGILKVRVASPPVEGAANAELIKFFAKLLGVAKSNVEILSGQTSRTKRLRVAGITAAELEKAVHRSGNDRLSAIKSP